MPKFEIPSGAALESVRPCFAEQLTENELLMPDADIAAGVAASRLFAYVQRGESPVDDPIERALASSPAMRALHCRMTEAAALYRLPEAIAASSDDIPPPPAGHSSP